MRYNYPTSTDEAALWCDPCDAHLLKVECDEQDDEYTPNGKFHVHCHAKWWSRKVAARRPDRVAERYFSRPQA